MTTIRTLVVLLVSMLFAAVLVPQCEAKGDRVEQWVGAHTRLLWVQDHGDGADSLAHGKNLKLYGYDSRDGRGERPLLDRVDNYFRPMFTPDGEPDIDRAMLSAKADDLERMVKRLKAMIEGLRHAAACPAPSHAACPSFQRLLKAAAAGALENRQRRLGPR